MNSTTSLMMGRSPRCYLIAVLFLATLCFIAWTNLKQPNNGDQVSRTVEVQHHADHRSSLPFEDKIKLTNYSMDHPDVIAQIQKSVVLPADRKLLKLSKVSPSGAYEGLGESQYVDELLQQKQNGFFVECGAFNGETHSTTLFFETLRKWTGLLVEVSETNYKALMTKKRHAYCLHACLSPYPYPLKMNYRDAKASGGLTDLLLKAQRDYVNRNLGGGVHRSSICYPLYSVLLAINQTRIDFFSLDIEGAEIAVLQTIPFDKVHIDIIAIEYFMPGSQQASENRLKEIRDYFQTLGSYKEMKTLKGYDVVFRKIQ